ncbi:MAG: YdiU family protein [Actinomycetia bacterium]|nr:YdiU family protein [Actinomycetes bacterium]
MSQASDSRDPVHSDAPVQADPLSSVTGWRFTNPFTESLPGDANEHNGRRQVHGAAYSFVSPAKVDEPRLVAHSREVAEMLDLGSEAASDPLFVEVMAGNHVLEGSEPFAMAYAGHQFGNWAGQLGDGRAISLGEVSTHLAGTQMLQLKGAGPTPYSRTADGLAVLRSSIREFLCSEAMHHLRIPTTRALSLVTTGEYVARDMFYDGNVQMEPGAIVCRVSPTFVRFGSFELPASRHDVGLLRKIAVHTITQHFPHLLDGSGSASPAQIGPDQYLAWFVEVRDRTARLMAEWMRVGFVHGVMNTDNMSILGETIDYGPYGWIDDFDPNWTPNTTDFSHRRYRFAQQPQVAHWNLMQFANAIFPLVDDVERVTAALDGYVDVYQSHWRSAVQAKLGLGEELPGDAELADTCFSLLQRVETDMTIFFRALGSAALDAAIGESRAIADVMGPAIYRPEEWSRDDVEATVSWIELWHERVSSTGREPAERRASMNASNPKFVLRNHLAQVAIDKAHEGDFSEVERLLELVRHPYDEQPGMDEYASKRPEWARTRAGCSTLSCSS